MLQIVRQEGGSRLYAQEEAGGPLLGRTDLNAHFSASKAAELRDARMAVESGKLSIEDFPVAVSGVAVSSGPAFEVEGAEAAL